MEELKDCTKDYLLNKKVTIFQPTEGYRASTDAVFLAATATFVAPNEKILDVGSGTGAVSLCLAHHLPLSDITGLEIQNNLVALSTASATANGFEHLKYIACDILKQPSVVTGNSFDRVFTNPPYYEHQSVSPKESKALAHGQSDFDLAHWLGFCLKKLKPFGYLHLIYPPEGLPRILNILSGSVGRIRILPFYTRCFAPAKRILITAQKTSKAPTVILPPFYVRSETGEHTKESRTILEDGACFSNLDF